VLREPYLTAKANVLAVREPAVPKASGWMRADSTSREFEPVRVQVSEDIVPTP